MRFIKSPVDCKMFPGILCLKSRHRTTYCSVSLYPPLDVGNVNLVISRMRLRPTDTLGWHKASFSRQLHLHTPSLTSLFMPVRVLIEGT